jgi:hypothetical protein
LAYRDAYLRDTAIINGVARNAFVSISDEDELLADLVNNLSDAFAVQIGFGGNTQFVDGQVMQVFKHTLRFYAKASIEDFSQPAKQAAYEKAYIIADAWRQRIMNDSVASDGCGVFGYIDLGSFAFTKMPMLYDYHYGWQLTFSEENSNQDYLTQDNYWQ